MMKSWKKIARGLLLSACIPLSASALTPGALNVTPKELEGVGIFPNLGKTISLDTTFQDESGQNVKLGKYFDGHKPVVVIMAYYGCPMLCGLVLNAAREALQRFEWKIGEKYEVITVSVDPREGATLAQAKKANILAQWPAESRSSAEAGWHFLTASAPASEKLAGELGFRYRLNKENDQYAHAPGIFFLSPRPSLPAFYTGSNILLRT